MISDNLHLNSDKKVFAYPLFSWLLQKAKKEKSYLKSWSKTK
ncbi:Hypothetical protein I595_892 [Croceitalea dokdonensis DOKDO 023]|uniref:Uncharacterized protein n=1 Tax=Croceitalea dokdonensis DOKDO 023 TaxID=1300341 RepID=A0A0N8H461_9FLAO|nr:Hypothetical protein I595_892 [Croceitalea dokdonensis DOKDO 023]